MLQSLPAAGKTVLATTALVLSFQMAEHLMTLAYDNGINLFDTAEVYAAGKYVLFSREKVARGTFEGPHLLLPHRSFLGAHSTVSHSLFFLNDLRYFDGA